MANKITNVYQKYLTALMDGSFFTSSVFRFIIIGGFNTIHNFVWYNLFLSMGIPYQLAFTFAFALAMTASFFLNTKFAFKTKPTLKKFIQFPVTALPNFLISQLGLMLLVDRLGFEKGISGLLASLAAIPVTFLVTRLILTKDDAKSDDKVQPKTNDKADDQANVKADDQADVQAEVQIDQQTDVQIDNQPDDQLDHQIGGQADDKSDDKSDHSDDRLDGTLELSSVDPVDPTLQAVSDNGLTEPTTAPVSDPGKGQGGKPPVGRPQLENASPANTWLDPWDLLIFLCLVVFSLLLHKYIFDSGFLYGDDHTDSTVQMIYFLPFLIKNFILNGNFWSWNYGMGGDIFSEFSYYYTTSPLIWSLFPMLKALPETFWTLANSLNLKLFISIYKQVLIMVFMYVLLRYEKRTRSASIAAALVYGGGIYYMWNANFFDFMTDAYLWVPLMVLGFRIYERRKKFWPLVLAAAMAAINNYYFAFHTFVFFIVFVLFFTSPTGNTLREKVNSYFSKISQYALMGIAALLLSMFAFLPAAMAFLRIDRFDTVNPVSILYGKDFYMNMPINLFFNNSTIGIPMLIILFLFIDYKKATAMTRRKMGFLVLFLALYCLPFTGYFLNGMNYHSERWFYLLIFVFAYSLADILDEMKKPHHFNLIFFSVILLFASVMIFTRWDIIQTFDDKPIYVAVLAFNMIAFLMVTIRMYLKTPDQRMVADITIVVMIFGIMAGNNFAFAGDQTLNMDTEKLAELKMESPELHDIFSQTVPNENEFYRTVFRNTQFENSPTYYNYYGISTFSSMTDGNTHDWLKRILDIRHNIVYLSSFNNVDDRAFLESLLSVRYVVSEKGSYTPPPIYTLVYFNEAYDLWENQAYVGMDMWFTAELPLNNFLQLTIPDKDINLFNYAVTDTDNGLVKGEPILAENIPLDKDTMTLVNVDYTMDRIDFAKDSRVRFTIPNPNPYSQVYLHSYLRPEDRKEFEQKVNSKKSFKSYESNPYVYYTNDWTFAMNGSETHLTWTTNQKAYEINDLYLRRVDLTDLAATVANRNQYNLENLKIGKDEISGTVNNLELGIMVFNIPYNKGWTVTDNGNKIELQRMNGFLSGVKLEPGEHNLQFKFRSQGFYIGLIISLLTLLALIGFTLWRRIYRKAWLIGDPRAIEPIYPEPTPLPDLYPENDPSDLDALDREYLETSEDDLPVDNPENVSPGDLKDVPDDPYMSDQDDIQSYDLADIQLIESEDAEMDELEIIHPQDLERIQMDDFDTIQAYDQEDDLAAYYDDSSDNFSTDAPEDIPEDSPDDYSEDASEDPSDDKFEDDQKQGPADKGDR